MEVVLAVAILWVVPIFVGRAIGKPKNRLGGWWGFCLGWLGVIIVALLPARPPMTLEELERRRATSSPAWYETKRAALVASQTMRECPYCKENMRRDASVCPHCRHESEPWTLHEGNWWARRGDGWQRFDELTGEWM